MSEEMNSGCAGEDIDGQEAYEAWRRVKDLAESGVTPQIDARDVLDALANDLEAGRLADQCTRLPRNQLLGELDEARAALDASQGQVKQLEAEAAELRDLADRQADLLSRTAVAISGSESHHDLPDLAAAMRQQRDICASAANKIQWATPDYAHMEGVCPECGQYEHDGHGDDCMVGRACGIYDVLRLTGALK